MNFFNEDKKPKETQEKQLKENKEKDLKEKNPEAKDLDFNQMKTERQQIKKDIEKSLKELLFTKDEIKETMKIIDETYAQIQSLKDMLIGTNINYNPHFLEKETYAMITGLTEEMHIALKKKVKEIMARRMRGE